MTGRTRVTLSDDHPVVLAGLKKLIEANDDLEVVGEATSGTAALAVIKEKHPHVAIIDISMPHLNGIKLSRRISAECPAVGILILTLHEDRAYVKQALEAGARGYVLKRSAGESLVQAIRAVAVGGLFVDSSMAGHVVRADNGKQRSSNTSAEVRDLTDRERDVLKLTALGFTQKEIAQKIDVGLKSVETYKSRGMQKLGVASRADLVRYASLEGWLTEV